MTAPLLEASGIISGYDGVAVVNGIDLVVRAGEVVALIGPNGAGKSTTMLTLAGNMNPTRGEVRRDGQAIRAPMHKRVRGGMAVVPEVRTVIPTLTVRQNLALGLGSLESALDLFPELREHLDRLGGALSGGQQQMLTLARALAANPVLLLADELSMGLAPVIVKRLLSAVRVTADAGAGVLLVDQHARNVLRIADRGYVMSRGTFVHEGSSAELLRDLAAIEAAYLGGVAEVYDQLPGRAASAP